MLVDPAHFMQGTRKQFCTAPQNLLVHSKNIEHLGQ